VELKMDAYARKYDTLTLTLAFRGSHSRKLLLYTYVVL
jgi:hypothetical protein